MERKNIFVAIAIAIILLSISPIHIYGDGELINPYENWIEPKDLKNCSMAFAANAISKYSSPDEESLSVEHPISGEFFFENGEFDNSSNTFNALNITNVTLVLGETFKMVSKKEFQVTFDSGLNNIESFSLSSIITRNSIDSGESVESKFLIKGFGASFPFSKEILGSSETESGFVEIVDTKNTSYVLREPEKMGKYIKEIVSGHIITKEVKGKYETSKLELIEFKFNESSYLKIIFDGYLPRLRDSEGRCSWFGGKNDTGIDVALRKQFCKENFKKPGEPYDYDSKIFKRKEISDEFDTWMNDRVTNFGNWKNAGWEGTALDCGPARNLDTENSYFCAMRWHDNVTEKYNSYGKIGHTHWWREQKVKVTNTENNKSVIVAPVDWGPHERTNRTIDLSRRAIKEINATTDNTWVEMCLVDSDTPLGLVIN
jgi:hypothetical protein